MITRLDIWDKRFILHLQEISAEYLKLSFSIGQDPHICIQLAFDFLFPFLLIEYVTQRHCFDHFL